MYSLTNDGEDVFLDEDDILEEIDIDEEDLPDADDSDSEAFDEEADDSVHIFKRHAVAGSPSDPTLVPTGADYNKVTVEVYTVACSPSDPKLVATGASDNKGFLWKLDQVDSTFELQGHNESVSCVSFTSDGHLLASGSLDGLIQVWDIISTTLKCTLHGPESGIGWLRWHPRGHLLLAGSEVPTVSAGSEDPTVSEDPNVWMWYIADTVAYNPIVFPGHDKTVTCGDFTPDGKTICTGSEDASLRIWNLETGKTIHVVRGHNYHTEGLKRLAITADSSRVLTGSKDGSVHLVSITSGKVVSSLRSHTDEIECIGLSSSSGWAATGSLDGKLIIWDLQRLQARCTCEHGVRLEGVTCVCWLGGSRFVATGCEDGRVRIWDTLSGECVSILRGHTDPVESIAITGDGNHLVSVSGDGTARVFQIHEFH